MSINPVSNADGKSQTFTEIVGRSQEARIAGVNSFLAMLETSRKQSEEQRQYNQSVEKQNNENSIRQHETMRQREQHSRSVQQQGEMENYQHRLENREQRQENYIERSIAVSSNEVQSNGGEYIPSNISPAWDNAAGSPRFQSENVNPASGQHMHQSWNGTAATSANVPPVKTGDASPMTSADLKLATSISQPFSLSMPQSISQSIAGSVETTVSQTPANQAVSASMMTIFTAAGRFLNSGTTKTKEKQDEIKLTDKKDKGEEGCGTEKRISSSFGAAVFSKLAEIDDKSGGVTPAGSTTSAGNTQTHAGIEKTPLEQVTEEPKSGGVTPADPAELTEETRTSVAEQYERVQFVQRVAAACQSAAQQNGTMRFKLSVGENETLTLRVKTLKRDGKKDGNEIAVRFEVASKTTADLLSAEIDSLISTLAELGTVLRKSNTEIISA
ncbi:MAG: hypothetical protein FWE67_03990 [Planctomycetaceae bacterium]|nr:hypothetical protein [Planctomycetaceae bacterium]